MHEKDILNKIIENDGECDWILQDDHYLVESFICSSCPLSRLEKRPDGSYMSCYGSLIKSPADEDNMNEIYTKAAANKLMDLQIEEELSPPMDRRDRIILIGNLNNVLHKLLLSDTTCPFNANSDITTWQIYEVEKQWKKLRYKK